MRMILLRMSYYYPYFCGNKISTTEQIDIEKHAEKESYAGICDEVRLGVTLIFICRMWRIICL